MSRSKGEDREGNTGIVGPPVLANALCEYQLAQVALFVDRSFGREAEERASKGFWEFPPKKKKKGTAYKNHL